jgi:sec-independent protein translocase protein TatB
MFDIGFLELVLVAIVGLLVLGPERLPQAVRTGSLWLSKLRRSFNSIKSEINQELNTDEIKREIHNATILDNLKTVGEELSQEAQGIKNHLPETPYDISDVIDSGSTNPSPNIKTDPEP